MLHIHKKSIKDVFKLALPAVGEMILYMIIWVFDTMMVGKYGGQLTVTAVGLGSEIVYTFVNVFIGAGLSIGITSIIARRYGAKEYKEAEDFASIGFRVGAIIAFVLAVLFYFLAEPILILARADANVIVLGTTYIKICSFGVFFSMMMMVFNGIIRGSGNTTPPLIAALIINIINIGLDIVLIFGYLGFPELGVAGAALATSIAHFFGFVYILWYMIKKSKIKCRVKNVSFDKTQFKELVKLSVPSGLQEAAFSVCRLINTFMIVILGTVAFSANQITTTIESLSFMPGYGFAVAATTLVGHKVGEKNYKQAKEYAHTSVLLAAIIMGICSILFLLFPEWIISKFIKVEEVEVIKLGAMCLRLAAIEQIPMAISMVLGGSLKGAGDTKTPFGVALITNWLIRLPLMYYFIYVQQAPVTFVWGITAVQWIIDAGLMFALYRRKLRKTGF